MSTSDEIKLKNEEFAKMLIPLIRRIVPGLIAADIVGVQPMNVFDIKPGAITIERLDDGSTSGVRIRVGREYSPGYGFPSSPAKPAGIGENEAVKITEWCKERGFGTRIAFNVWLLDNEEQLTLFTLRWKGVTHINTECE